MTSTPAPGGPPPPHRLDLGAYFARIGYAGAPRPTAESLADLHQAHVESIPFENLDVLLNRPIRLDLGSLEAKLVWARRGGYCFEHGTLFAAVLEQVGFRVTRLLARVRFGVPPGTVTARSHMVLLVETERGPFVADPGFGGHTLWVPLPLVEQQPQWIGDEGHALFRDAQGHWILQAELHGSWKDLYAFSLEPQFPVDFEVANHFTSTHPSSIFRRSLMLSRLWPGGRASLRDNEMTVWNRGVPTRTLLGSQAELLGALAEGFGLSLPEASALRVPAVP